MSLSSHFGYTNKTAGTPAVTVAIGPVTNYAKVEDEADTVQLSNKTAPLDQGERVMYQSRTIPVVNTNQVIQNPAKVLSGVQYQVRLDEILRTTDASGAIICDEPIVMYLTIRHPLSGNITEAQIVEVLSRLIGACYDETATSFRFDDLMRSALMPVED